MLSTIIIDDEPLAVESLCMILKKCAPGVNVIATSNSPEMGRQLLIEHKLDILFVDIEMPGLSGIELVRSIPDPSFKVVFVTAFDQYAIEALRLSAIDYILKPAQPEDIMRVIDRVSSGGYETKTSWEKKFEQFEQILNTNAGKAGKKLGIAMHNKIIFIDTSDILYCRAEGPYTHIYTTDGKKMVSSKTLGEFEAQLAAVNFFRIHHSTLINIMHMREFQKNDGAYVVMENNARLEVSHRKKIDFIRAINNQLI